MRNAHDPGVTSQDLGGTRVSIADVGLKVFERKTPGRIPGAESEALARIFPDFTGIPPSDTVHILEGHSVVPRHGVICTPANELVLESTRFVGARPIFGEARSRGDLRIPADVPRAQIDEDVFIIHSSARNNYAHYIIDTLTSLELFRSLGCPGSVRVLWGGGKKNAYQGALTDLIAPDIELYDCGRQGLVTFRHILFPSPVGYRHKLGVSGALPEIFAKLKSRVPESDDKTYPEKIYIDRSDYSRRPVMNGEALLEGLAKHGFTPIDPGKHSVPDQISMFRNARIVVGLHGAGFTNSGFCRPGTTVIEVIGENHLYSGFGQISLMADLDYHPVVAPVVQTDKHLSRADARLEVPLEEIWSLLG